MLNRRFSNEVMHLRSTWQARALAGTDGQLNAVVMSILAHNYDEHMGTLLAVVYPDYAAGNTVMRDAIYCSAARIDKAGQVVADMINRYGVKTRNSVVFESEIQMRGVFRRLADVMRLTDHDRLELFKAAKNWVVADRRLDPTMDPKDPDAKRLVVH